MTRDIAEALRNGDSEAAARALAAYGGAKGEALTRREELELAQELVEAAEALAEGDPELAEQLAGAADAIEQGDITTAREAIREAARRMGEAGERVERQEAVEGTLAQLQEGREEIAQAGST
jgi:DNA-binding FadR family transcriptional regulator